MPNWTALFLALSLTASAAVAHEARQGPNGGKLVDAGSQYHAELVAKGTTEVVVHMSDATDKPIPAEGFRANAILVVNGQTIRFALQPAGGSRLVGTAPVPVPAGVRGAVQITSPQGATAQARF
ncbi:MAG: hypothetical protein Q8O26_14285 [Phreatobacter sp.]|uniref:hypothetical protein n=1 Tax=Phreatobacter sp. TaxID=1966341 RepID=UPI002733A708|nr:hypothetical protein [Phreatobacter sp.]MDP2803041.1 hypothetical protein [Phreatobacter sp.]